MDEIDGELATSPPTDPRSGWRISPQKITFVRVEDPEGGREIEVSDIEVTVALFGRFVKDHPHSLATSPEPLCPANTISYYDAAEFCNLLVPPRGCRPRFAPEAS